MLILESLQWANNKLKKAGVDSPMLDAELLLASVVKQPKSWIFAHGTDQLKPHHEEAFRLLIDRRAKREPVAYILGTQDFYGRTFNINKSVLIPRPETEQLIDLAIESLNDHEPNRTLLCDIGTGSGAIAITLALETTHPVIASDIDQEALTTAKDNREQLNATELVEFRHGNLAEPLILLFKTLRGNKENPANNLYPYKHLIICANLPYIPESKRDAIKPEVADYEPATALYSGPDGLTHYRELLRQITLNRHVLPQHITLLMEIEPYQTSNATNDIEALFPQATITTHKDLHNDIRILKAVL